MVPLPLSTLTPARFEHGLRWRAARAFRRAAARMEPRKADPRAMGSGTPITVRHQTIWADRDVPRLTVAVGPAPVDGLLALSFGGRPLTPTGEPGVWECLLIDEPCWADGPLPLPAGRLRIEATVDGIPVPVRSSCRPSVVAGGVRFAIESPNHLRVLGPHTDAVRTADEKDAAVAEIMAAERRLIDAVYLEVFSGRQAGWTADSPGAIAAHLAESRPGLRLIWGCRDGAALAQVPPGHKGVLIGSRDWAEAVTTARWLVVNDWLDPRYVKRDGQVVLQTWHGSMYKKIGLDRPNRTADDYANAQAQIAAWDLLVSQNPESTARLRTAYEWAEPLEAGYPRNDRIASGRVDRDRARSRLGIDLEQKVVLYAPTFRDAGLDPSAVVPATQLAERLGSGYVVLARSHGRAEGSADTHPRVVDVTRHPDLAELMVASDMLVTDYSSMMFDYALTGRPMVFLAPDLEAYEASRGVCFDLRVEAPGPVVSTLDEAAAAIRDEDVLAVSTMQVELWRHRWTPWDDGHAAERAVNALFAIVAPSARTWAPRRNSAAAA